MNVEWRNNNTHETPPWAQVPPTIELTVRTYLPDEYVLPIVEELQHQQKREPGTLPEVFIRMEIARGPVIEGEVTTGPKALPEEKKGLPS